MPLMHRHPILDAPALAPATTLLSVNSGSGRENKCPQTAPRWLVGILTHYIEAKWHANVRIAFRRWKYQAKYAFSLKFTVPIQHNIHSKCLDRVNQLFPHSQSMLTRHAWRQCGAQKILLMLDQRFLAMVGASFYQWRQQTRKLTHSIRRFLFKWSDFTYLRKIARLSAERFIFLTIPLVRAFNCRLKALAMEKFKSNLRWYKATIHMRFAFRSWKAHTREFRALRQIHCKPVIVAWSHQARLERHELQRRAALTATSVVRRSFRQWKRRTLKVQHSLLWAAMRPRSPKLQLIRAWRTWLDRIRTTVMRSRSPNRHRPNTSASVMSLRSPRGRESPSFFRGSRSSSASFSSFSHGRVLNSQPPFRTGLSPSHLHSRRSGDALASSASSPANSSLASFDRKLWLDVTRGKYQSRTMSSPVSEDRIVANGGNSSPYQQKSRQTAHQRSQHQATIATARIVKSRIVSIQPAPSPLSGRYLTEDSESDLSSAAAATDTDLTWEMNSVENRPPQRISSSESGPNHRNNRYHDNRQSTSPSALLCMPPSNDLVCSVSDWFKQPSHVATAVAVTNGDCDDITEDCTATSSHISEPLQLKLQELELSTTADAPFHLQLPLVLEPNDSEPTKIAELGLDVNVDTSASSAGAPIAEVGGNNCEPPRLHENTKNVGTMAIILEGKTAGEELALPLKIEQPHQLEQFDFPDTVIYSTSAVATEAAEIAAIERKAKRYLKASQSTSKPNVPKLTAQEKLKWRLYRAKQLSASIDQQTAVGSHSRANATKASEHKR